MKRAWFQFVAIAVVLLSPAGAQNPGAAVNRPGPEDGTIVSNTYANEFLGFWFPIPDGWQVNRESFGAEREGEAKRTPGGGLELLVVDRSGPAMEVQAVLVEWGAFGNANSGFRVICDTAAIVIAVTMCSMTTTRYS